MSIGVPPGMVLDLLLFPLMVVEERIQLEEVFFTPFLKTGRVFIYKRVRGVNRKDSREGERRKLNGRIGIHLNANECPGRRYHTGKGRLLPWQNPLCGLRAPRPLSEQAWPLLFLLPQGKGGPTTLNCRGNKNILMGNLAATANVTEWNLGVRQAQR